MSCGPKGSLVGISQLALKGGQLSLLVCTDPLSANKLLLKGCDVKDSLVGVSQHALNLKKGHLSLLVCTNFLCTAKLLLK